MPWRAMNQTFINDPSPLSPAERELIFAVAAEIRTQVDSVWGHFACARGQSVRWSHFTEAKMRRATDMRCTSVGPS